MNTKHVLTEAQQQEAIALLRATLEDIESGSIVESAETRGYAVESIKAFLAQVQHENH